MLLVSLIGEQPVPNLIPIRYRKPDENLLVYTSNDNIQRTAKRLRRLLSGHDSLQADLLVDAYDLVKCRMAILKKLAGNSQVVFNLTGGTKIMSAAAHEAARAMNAPWVYYQTEGRRGRDQQGVLYEYGFSANGESLQQKRDVLPGDLLKLDEYLKAHLDSGYRVDGPSRQAGGEMEQAVFAALKDVVDEILVGVKPEGIQDQAEMDLLLRCGNQVAVVEIKSGGSGSGKHALDQLTTIAAREYLGTYAARILVTQSNPEVKNNWYVLLARALRVEVIEIQKPPRNSRLDPQDIINLRQRLAMLLPCRH